jgi:nucleotide-binding universal stress UspA family protein
MVALKHVLVATDFGEPAGVALDYGRELARVFGATLHVVHVVDDINARALGLTGFPEHMPVLEGVQQDLQSAARDTLARLITEDDRRRLSVRTVVLTGLTPADAILEYAKEALVNLIIVGTHGRGAVAHLFMGSVAERLVRAAPCPVLTVRHPEREFLRPDALAATARHEH